MTDQHADLDALADALAAESDGQPLPEHLQTCGQCGGALAALRAALGAVATDLAGLPAVPDVPEALQRSVVPTTPIGATTVLPSASVTSLEERRRAPRWLLAAGGIAAAAVVVVGGGLLLTSNSTDSANNARSAAAPNQFPVSATGSDYLSAAALQSALPRLLSGKPEALDSVGAGPTHASQVAPSKALADPLASLRTTQGLAACLASLTDVNDPGVPLALDYAAYQGKPALVVVLPSVKPSKLDIWVVGAGCNTDDPHLLLYAKADRPQ
jgi:hypothetical protein